MLGTTLAIFVVTVLCFHAAGYFQFGARYLFDAYPYAFLLLVISEMRFDWRVLALGAIGVIVNLLGAYQFWTGLVPHL